MRVYPDLPTYIGATAKTFAWLQSQGVRVDVLESLAMMPLRLAHGHVGDDGIFEDDISGPPHLVFPQHDDVVYWHPKSGSLGSWNGRSFALGEDMVDIPETYAFDCNLNLFPDPMQWLKAKRDGIVILDWHRAWIRLQDAPRIAVHDSLLPLFKRHFQPPHKPEISIFKTDRSVVTTRHIPMKDRPNDIRNRAA